MSLEYKPPTYGQRAEKVIAQKALTNSKRPECFVNGSPTHATKGNGAFIYDDKNRMYVDYICGLGTNLLGYDFFSPVDFGNMLKDGITLSLSTTAEVDLAEELIPMFPFIEQIKILKSGSDGCTAAIRIARANDKRRSIIYSDGYHGFHGEFVSLTPPAHGIPVGDFNHIYKLDDLTGIKHPSNVCAIIIEPVITDYSEKRRQYLIAVRQFCDDKGILLIFDETITALRFPGGSVAKHWGVTPDLIIFGKALGNGFPISVVGGRKDLMSNPNYFVSTSFAGERISIEAARMVIRELKTKKILDRLWEDGGRFLKQFNAISEHLQIVGYPTRGVFKCQFPLTKALFFQEAVKAGILFGESWFWNLYHVHLIDRTINVCKDIITRIENNQVKLEGEMPATPFAQKVRGG